uniref:Uncharacterized protein n=1 Tax=Macaca fascicularis TaxID=9541 RepID=A0A7N9D3A4_MACFA
VCWRFLRGVLHPVSFLQCLWCCLIQKSNSRVHVHNVQVCYICIHVPCWCAAPINSSFTINSKVHSL